MKFFKGMLAIIVLFGISSIDARSRDVVGTPEKPIDEKKPINKEKPEQVPPTLQKKSYPILRNEIKSMTKNKVLNSDSTAFAEPFIKFMKDNVIASKLSPIEIESLLQAGISFHATWDTNQQNSRNQLAKLNLEIARISQELTGKKSPEEQSSIKEFYDPKLGLLKQDYLTKRVNEKITEAGEWGITAEKIATLLMEELSPQLIKIWFDNKSGNPQALQLRQMRQIEEIATDELAKQPKPTKPTQSALILYDQWENKFNTDNIKKRMMQLTGKGYNIAEVKAQLREDLKVEMGSEWWNKNRNEILPLIKQLDSEIDSQIQKQGKQPEEVPINMDELFNPAKPKLEAVLQKDIENYIDILLTTNKTPISIYINNPNEYKQGGATETLKDLIDIMKKQFANLDKQTLAQLFTTKLSVLLTNLNDQQKSELNNIIKQEFNK
ncbi:MAG TPA: hypothetical protein VLB80_00195 [Candidatus Babeliales bacterium]|nr:hypothetical protein [Candidatus Babeliales bacterium]